MTNERTTNHGEMRCIHSNTLRKLNAWLTKRNIPELKHVKKLERNEIDHTRDNYRMKLELVNNETISNYKLNN